MIIMTVPFLLPLLGHHCGAAKCYTVSCLILPYPTLWHGKSLAILFLCSPLERRFDSPRGIDDPRGISCDPKEKREDFGIFLFFRLALLPRTSFTFHRISFILTFSHSFQPLPKLSTTPPPILLIFSPHILYFP